MPCIDAKQESEASGSLAAPGTSHMLPCDPTSFVCLRKGLDGVDYLANGTVSQCTSGAGTGDISGVLLPSAAFKSHEAEETGSDSGHSSPVQHSPVSRNHDEEATAAAARHVPTGIKVETDFENDSECGLNSDQEDTICGAGRHYLGDAPFEDDFGELTSLAWLLDENLLRNLAAAGDRELQKYRKQSFPSSTTASFVPADSDRMGSVGASAVAGGCHAAVQLPPWQFVRGSKKPPFSFACLIFMAIEESPNRRLPVKAIYEWILRNFPYYQSAPSGWKNSVRHNLSLNKCFRKLDHDILRLEGNNKGACWCVDPLYRPNLLQALRRTPYYGNQQVQLLSLTSTGSRPTARLSAEVSPSTVCYRAPALPHGLDIEAANALVSLRMPAVKRESSPDSASTNDGESSSCDSFRGFSSTPAAKRQRFHDNEYDDAQVRSLQSEVVADAPSSDHTYTVVPPSAADRGTPSETFRLAGSYEQVKSDSVQSHGSSDASNGKELELCRDRSLAAAVRSAATRGSTTVSPCSSTVTDVAAIALSASDRLCNSGREPRLRRRVALQARACTVICDSRSTSSASSNLQSDAASATRGGGSSLLSLASAASLAMMDDKLLHSGVSHR